MGSTRARNRGTLSGLDVAADWRSNLDMGVAREACRMAKLSEGIGVCLISFGVVVIFEVNRCIPYATPGYFESTTTLVNNNIMDQVQRYEATITVV